MGRLLSSYQDFNKKFQNIMLNVWNIKYNSLKHIHNRLQGKFFKTKR